MSRLGYQASHLNGWAAQKVSMTLGWLTPFHEAFSSSDEIIHVGEKMRGGKRCMASRERRHYCVFPLRLCILMTGVSGLGVLGVLHSPFRSSWIEVSKESIRDDICDTASCSYHEPSCGKCKQMNTLRSRTWVDVSSNFSSNCLSTVSTYRYWSLRN